MGENVEGQEIGLLHEEGELDLNDPSDSEAFDEYSKVVQAILNGTIPPDEAAKLLALREKRITGEDRFTSVGNKISFNRELRQIEAEGKRSGKKRTVFFIDGNNFGGVNKHGKNVGDEVIQTLAESLKLAVRETDKIYRFGGDEFAVILDEGADIDAGIDAVMRVQDMIETSRSLRHEILKDLTISTGVAEFDPKIDQTSGEFFIRLERAQDASKTPARDNHIGLSTINTVTKKPEFQLITAQQLQQRRIDRPNYKGIQKAKTA